MPSDQTAKFRLRRVCQKVGHGLSGVFLDKTSLFYVLGLATFYPLNLTDIFNPSLIVGAEGAAELSTMVSSLCNVAGYVAIALVLSRLRCFGRLAAAAAVAGALAIVGSWALWTLGAVGSVEALLVYKGATRICAAFVIVAWGIRFSDLESALLTRRALAAFLVATVAFLALGVLRGLSQCLLLAALLPASMVLWHRIGPGGASGAAVGGAASVGAVRQFASSVWRVLLVFSLFGVVTWVVILDAQATSPGGVAGSFVAGACFVVMACLLVASCLFESAISYRYVFKLVLPLVMVGLLLVVALEGFRGMGAALVSVGYTCFDLFCFVMVASACRQSGVRAGAAFGWYRALESFLPVPALGLTLLANIVGMRDGNGALYVLVAACVLVLAVVLVFDRGNIMERSYLNPAVNYPRAEALYFARQCEAAIERYELSPREAEVLSLVVRGRSVPHIAERLYLSRGTVKTHIARIYQKFGARDRQAMIDIIESIALDDA